MTVDGIAPGYRASGAAHVEHLNVQALTRDRETRSPLASDITGDSRFDLMLPEGDKPIRGSYAVNVAHVRIAGYEARGVVGNGRIDGTTIQFLMGVDDGLFVGTEVGTYFMKGDTFAEMTLTLVVASPAVKGSAVRADASVLNRENVPGKEICLFSTCLGVYLGLPDGTAVNLTQERYRFSPPASAAAVVRHTDTLTQYLLTTT
jgi:hypothetical protein